MSSNGKPPPGFDAKTVAFEPEPERDEGGGARPMLQVLVGPEPGMHIPVPVGGLTLGRTFEADVVFDDAKLSRRHARLLFDAERGVPEVEDLGSTNGTFVNGRRVDRVELRDGDRLQAGSIVLKFRLLDALELESAERVDRNLFRDALTGLVVERRFKADLDLALRIAEAEGRTLALFNMDLDGLKGVNDCHGHAMGAAVIAETGRRIGALFSERGQACRYGGDEFIAYLEGADAAAALARGEEICRAIRDRPFERGDVSLSLTISVGVSLFPEDALGSEALRAASDAALYRAKAAGRNGVSR